MQRMDVLTNRVFVTAEHNRRKVNTFGLVAWATVISLMAVWTVGPENINQLYERVHLNPLFNPEISTPVPPMQFDAPLRPQEGPFDFSVDPEFGYFPIQPDPTKPCILTSVRQVCS